ncbi:hypothetical protein PUR71_38825 [Streptomyces sp. SP17BM10]|uniref:hypothetical protein n=1 Tax=Streptomyces sp. SP17BM10 TaxID=3002530 RepID=UPI002E775B15|nr:hypothetical protein [Streptomyces sp. SP17BM10]MEE1788814.1 hypothetical protein [Streptomyces sp. SP17BM10]
MNDDSGAAPAPQVQRPTPALMAAFSKPEPVRLVEQRTGSARVPMKASLLLGLPPEELLEELGVFDAVVAPRIVGGEDVWRRLTDPRQRGSAVGPAWQNCLDFQSGFGRDESDPEAAQSLLAVVVHIRAAFTAKSAEVTRSLRSKEMSWPASWREVNMRLAGQLYRYGLDRSRRGHEDGPRIAFRAALECWDVVELFTDRDTEEHRRLWRGMRGVARLFTARRSADPLPVLRAAVADLVAAEECGDRTPQHFCVLAEVHLRVFWLTEDQDALEQAARTLRSARELGHTSGELASIIGDVHRIRALGAMVRAGLRRPVVVTFTGTDLLDGGGGAETESVDDIEPAPGPDPGPGTAALRAARSGFTAAASWYTHALGLPFSGGMAPEVIRIRRGQALLRTVTCLKRLGRPYQAVLEAALADLRLCHDEDSRIRSDYLAWGLVELGRLLIRKPDGAGLHAAAQAFQEAAGFVERRLPDATDLHRRATVGLVEVRLRLALSGADVAAVRAALSAALDCATGEIAVTPLIYACRTLLDARTGQNPDPVDAVLLSSAVVRLEAEMAAVDGEGPRRFTAGHVATLLERARWAGVAEIPGVTTARILELNRLALQGEPAPAPLRLYAFARAGVRHARELIALDSAGDRRRVAEELLGEAIDAYGRVHVMAEPIWAEQAPAGDGTASRGPAEDLVVGLDERDAARVDVPEERDLASYLGEAHLRRGVLVSDPDDLSRAIEWFERSVSSGNDTPEVLGLLGDAHWRRGRQRRHVADMRRALQLKEEARQAVSLRAEGGTAPARESWSVSSAIARRIWRVTAAPADFAEAARFAALAVATDPDWPWPWLQLADLADAPARLRAGLGTTPPADGRFELAADPEVWRCLVAGDAATLRATASELAVASEEFRRFVLGGRSQAYVLADPHGLLSTTLVLKPFDSAPAAEDELRQTTAFDQWLAEHAVGPWARTVRPVATVPAGTGDQRILVTLRVTGRPLSDLVKDALLAGERAPYDGLRQSVERCLRLLAAVHAWRGSPTGTPAHRLMKDGLKRDLRGLGVAEAAELAQSWCGAFPTDLPWLGKRDAHADNWLVTERGDVVALDLAATSWLPVGFEVAQLLEDTGLLGVDPAGHRERERLAALYLDTLAEFLPSVAGRLPTPDGPGWREGYACFAARRAVFLLNRLATDRNPGSAARRQHAREVLAWSARVKPSLAPLASAVLGSATGAS